LSRGERISGKVEQTRYPKRIRDLAISFSIATTSDVRGKGSSHPSKKKKYEERSVCMN